MVKYLYSKWDGTQETITFGADEALGTLLDSLLSSSSLEQALSRAWFEFLRGRLQKDPRQIIEKLIDQVHRLGPTGYVGQLGHHTEGEIKQLDSRLTEVLYIELDTLRHCLARILCHSTTDLSEGESEELRQILEHKQHLLHSLPDNIVERLVELQKYSFVNQKAQRRFLELVESLKKNNNGIDFVQMIDQVTKLSINDIVKSKQAIKHLNSLLRNGGSSVSLNSFRAFIRQHSAVFGSTPPGSIEQLLNQLSGILASASPELCRALHISLWNWTNDPELWAELAELLSYLEGPQRKKVIEEDTLKELLIKAGKDAGYIDPLRTTLADAGYLENEGPKLKLTPKAIRKLGQQALKEIFSNLKKGHLGNHQIHSRGSGGEHSGETKHYEFGELFDINLNRTLFNAILREGPKIPVRIGLEDLEINRTEHLTRAATVILIDQSRSMALFNNFASVKKVALALYGLITSQFPRDYLYIVGFSNYAREVPIELLPILTRNPDASGTNLHHALLLAQRILARHKSISKKIMLITDGEPTAYLEGDRAWFSYPPSYMIERVTLREACQCALSNIPINTFMLDNNYHLVNFIEKLTRVNRGRVFYTTSENLGEYILTDYINNKQQHIRG